MDFYPHFTVSGGLDFYQGLTDRIVILILYCERAQRHEKSFYFPFLLKLYFVNMLCI